MDDFIETYKNWLRSRQWAKRCPLLPAERKILAEADNVKKRGWNGLDENRRKEIISQLIEEGILPKETKPLIDIFDGKVVGI